MTADMNTSLLTLRVRRKRDLVLARQRARQLAGLLGFDLRGQLAFACGVFEAACRAALQLGRITLEFRLTGDALQAHCRQSVTADPETVPIPCVQKRLPHPLPQDREDLAWLVDKFTRRLPEDLFDELRQQNSEMLRALAELQQAEAKLAQATPRAGSAAA
jgi:hypothetical protein